MEKITEWNEDVMNSLSVMTTEIGKVIPNIIGAIVVLIIGWILTKVVVGIIKKALKFAKADKLDDKINEIEIFEGKKLNFNIIKITSKFVKWVMYIMLIIVVSDILNLTMVSEEISNLLRYLPQLFTALVIFTVGLLLANFVKKSIRSFFESMELSGAKIISQIVFLLILVFVSVTALNQAGVDTDIITSNITMILAAFLLAFALAFGFGAKVVVGDILRTYYARRTYEIGQIIEYNGKTYEVLAIENISVILKTDTGKLIVPIKDISESHIKVQG
ncbi:MULTISPECIES: mechanosensitive ion channel family protein [Meridianimaribacter]|uniref:Transporter (Transmembrane protein) n=1 Tax=Meridianimaribacter flavus TaxID=571115 RepID=A0ABY2G667_9FLAO|nr:MULTISPECIES: hypothetical protein [Meridianimaribacter]TBV27004.1 hypothetical protein DMZ43_07360 [Meridianimaribacter sp. CL38]TDY12556.1 putative transporter (transmembrane protein) [Meridianimaribacter flavus]